MSDLTAVVTRFQRQRLWLARLGWGVVALLSLVVFFASMQMALTTGLFARMPELAAELDIALFSIFANNQLLASNTVLIAAAALFLACFGIGLFLFWRKSNDWLAILASAMLITIGAGMSPAAFFLPILQPQWHLPASLLQALLFSSLVLFLYLLPNGRFVPAWTRPLALLWGLYAISWLIWPQLNPHRAGNFGALLIFLALAWTGVVAQIYRHRQTTGIERQQQKWIMFGGFFTHLFFGLLVVSSVIGLNQRLTAVAPLPIKLLNTLFGFSVFFIPISIVIAVFRYRLWELNIWINRTLVYGGLTAIILALYGLSVGLLSSLIPGENDRLIPFVALFAAAVSVIPAHRSLKKYADRRFPSQFGPPDQAASPSTPTTHRRLRARLVIYLARFGWLAVFLLVLGMIAANLPHVYRDTLMEWQVGEAMVAALRYFPLRDAFIYTLITLRLITLSFFFLTALFLAWRKPDDWLVLYVSASLLMLGYFFGSHFDINVIRYPGWLEGGFPGVRAVAPSLIIISLFLFFFVFPNGRFYPRWLVWFAVPAILSVLTFMGEAFFPGTSWGRTINQFLSRLLPAGDDGWFLFACTLFTTMLLGLVSQLLRFRREPAGPARQQMKWALLGLTALVVAPCGELVLFDLLDVGYDSFRHLFSLFAWTVAPIALPVTLAIAVLRYRLWDVDVWINRTLVFGGLTLLVTVVYILSVGLLSQLFQAGGSVALSVLATGLIAILFNPLRGRLQAAVNRLMYGERDDPATVLASLGKRLEETAAPAQILPNLVETIAHSLRLPYVAIAVQRATNSEIVASFPEGTEDQDSEAVGGPGALPAEQVVTLPLTYQSEPIGQLLVATRSPNESFNPAEMGLLRDIARQAGPAVHAYLLTADLQRSREQLVAAREEERRRLRRDLHDGLGPGLATVSVKVSAAQNLLETDPKQAARLLAEVQAESQGAVREIRRLVDGLRPSTLDQLGLLSAVREFVAQNENGQTQLAFQGPETLPPLPAAVEVATYRIVTEAVTNVLRHAAAETCHIRLSVDSHLQIEIRDDGRGLSEPLAPGVGLVSMRERAEELGGQFVIDSTKGMGTVLLVTLPLTSQG